MEWDSSHTNDHNIKLLYFKIRVFFMSLLRGEWNPETPDVVKSLINLNELKGFKPVTFIAYNPEDLLAPTSESFMEKVRSNLKAGSVECAVRDDSNLHRYFQPHNHSTGSGIVERFERNEEKIKAQAAKSGLTK